MHYKTIFSADRRQRWLLYSSVSDLVNLCLWEWMQSEEKKNLYFGQLAVSMQAYTIAPQITLIPLMVIILISNAFNALAMGCFRGHPFFCSCRDTHNGNEAASSSGLNCIWKTEIPMRGLYLIQNIAKKIGYKFRVSLNTEERKNEYLCVSND